MTGVPAGPRSITGVVAAALSAYGAGFITVLPLVAAQTVLGVAQDMALGLPPPKDPAALLAAMLSPAFLATAAVTSLASVSVGIGLLRVYDDILGGSGRLGAAQAWAGGQRLLLPLFGVSLIYGVAVAVGSIVLVPGLYIAVRWCAAFPALVLEGRGVRDSLQRSAQLLRGQWWHVNWVLGIAVLIYLVPEGISMALPDLLFAGVDTSSVSPEMGRSIALIAALASALLSALALPLLWATLVAILHDLRARQAPGPG